MQDLLLSTALLILNFVFIMLFFRLYGKSGLIAWCAISAVLANIQVTKNISFLGFEATLGNITYATGFLATDILCEFYGSKYAKRAAKCGILSIIAMTVLMQLSILITPSQSDTVQKSLETVFNLVPRICIASIAAYIVSSFHDILAYEFWKKKTDGKYLWLRNNASTFVSQLIDTIIFTVIAFAGLYSKETLMQLMATTLAIKWIVALADTSMIYTARRWVRKGKINDVSRIKHHSRTKDENSSEENIR